MTKREELGRPTHDDPDPSGISPIPAVIESGNVRLAGTLALPSKARVVIIFAHGSGSGRLSPRNSYVARVLQDSGLGTLLFDLLTAQEDGNYETRFDIGLLAQRLAAATAWLLAREDCRGFRLGYFGASTGAAAALEASVGVPEVRAIVSRGGRPDLAVDFLPRVTAPTLLLVGGLDDQVIGLNEEALARLTVTKKLVIIPGATHLFEEQGKLEEVARLAVEWFLEFA